MDQNSGFILDGVYSRAPQKNFSDAKKLVKVSAQNQAKGQTLK